MCKLTHSEQTQTLLITGMKGPVARFRKEVQQTLSLKKKKLTLSQQNR